MFLKKQTENEKKNFASCYFTSLGNW